MGALIQAQPQRNEARQARWDRLERADLFEHYRALRTQGLSERQAAKELKVPRTTLQAWRLWHDRLDICSGLDHRVGHFNAWCELAKSLQSKGGFTDTQTESRLVQRLTPLFSIMVFQ